MMCAPDKDIKMLIFYQSRRNTFPGGDFTLWAPQWLVWLLTSVTWTCAWWLGRRKWTRGMKLLYTSSRSCAISGVCHYSFCVLAIFSAFFLDHIDNPQLIQAKVPILKFCDVQEGIEIDLNCNNAVGIRNTHLLYCYTRRLYFSSIIELFMTGIFSGLARETIGFSGETVGTQIWNQRCQEHDPL